MKKTAVSTIVILALLCLLAGCGTSGKTGIQTALIGYEEPQYDWKTGGNEVLKVWGMYPDMERSYIKEAFDRYELLTGNRLEVSQFSKEEYEKRMKEAFNGGTKQPDIILSYGGTSIDAYRPDENFYDFSDAQWVDDLTDTSINQTVYHGKIIGLPHWEASISGTLYNKKIFDKYNIEIPQNQKEFMEVCEELLSHGVTPMYLPGKEVSMLLYQFPLDIIVEDQAILDGLNDQTLTYARLPQMEQVVNWYGEMAKKGYFGETFQTGDWNGMSEALSSQEYAMMLCWDTWLYTDFKGNPKDFGLMPAFVGVPETGTFEGPNLGLFIVNKHSPKLDTALDFITFLADPYNYNAAFAGVYTAPVFKNQIASISTPQYMEAERLIERNFHDSTAWLRIRGFSQMDAICILEFMDSFGRMTTKECLEKMDQLRLQRLDFTS